MANNGKFVNAQARTKLIHSNLDQEVILITEDRLRLILKDHISLVEDKKAWHTPLGLVVAISATFTTSQFRELFFKAETWQAAFLICGLISIYWLIKTSYRAIKSPSIDDLISKIKTSLASK